LKHRHLEKFTIWTKL